MDSINNLRSMLLSSIERTRETKKFVKQGLLKFKYYDCCYNDDYYYRVYSIIAGRYKGLYEFCYDLRYRNKEGAAPPEFELFYVRTVDNIEHSESVRVSRTLIGRNGSWFNGDYFYFRFIKHHVLQVAKVKSFDLIRFALTFSPHEISYTFKMFAQAYIDHEIRRFSSNQKRYVRDIPIRPETFLADFTYSLSHLLYLQTNKKIRKRKQLLEHYADCKH